MPDLPPPRLPYPYRDEAGVVDTALARLQGAGLAGAVVAEARPWVEAVRASPAPFWAMESLLREYPISSAEGLALMRLAEALLRVPDAETAIALTADQLGRADFDDAGGDGPHACWPACRPPPSRCRSHFLPGSGDAGDGGGLLGRLGARTVVAATVRAIQLLGRQFVLGRHIGEAMDEADAQRRAQAALRPSNAMPRRALPALRFSYDMLGEGARTDRDAAALPGGLPGRHRCASRRGVSPAPGPMAGDGISIKLSALFPRYEVLQRERVFAELLPRVWTLADAAARANMNLTIDAEESDRLEISRSTCSRQLAARVAAQAPAAGSGFGLAVQAYQTRSLAVVDAVARIAREAPCDGGLRFMVRLVKGAYWDGEIKRAQEGWAWRGYPVFTHKAAHRHRLPGLRAGAAGHMPT
jgi:RHH-type proline utilization regulon transcriptional repressor/proline dehydrogenase/delta 1-pyrroline-5-carboxylate dehydrogenase